MNFNHRIKSFALIMACALSAQTFTQDQTYTCDIRVASAKTASAPLRDNVKIQASSPADAKIKVKIKYTSPAALVYDVTSCTLKG